MPDVGDEECDVPSPSDDRHCTMAFPFKAFVGQLVDRWRPSGCVASGYDGGGPRFKRTVPQEDVGSDGEYRVRDARVPWDAGISGDVRSGIGMPEAAQVLVVARRLPPRRIGDDVAVLPEQGLDGPQDARSTDGTLDDGTAIEHLVTERRHLGGVVVGIPHIRRVLRKHPVTSALRVSTWGGLNTPLSTCSRPLRAPSKPTGLSHCEASDIRMTVSAQCDSAASRPQRTTDPLA